MNCKNVEGFNRFQVIKISAYLKAMKAETLKEKEYHASEFIRKNSEKMRKEYCGKICVFDCS
jgi:hypothetical protein